MESVFVLQHIHSQQCGAEDVKLIGVYSTREKAFDAVARMNILPGFVLAPDAFHIDEYRIDQDYWVEGFIVNSSTQ